MSKLAQVKSGQCQPGLKVYKTGGAVHGDEKMDRSLVKKMVKKESLTGKKCGGRAKK